MLDLFKTFRIIHCHTLAGKCYTDNVDENNSLHLARGQNPRRHPSIHRVYTYKDKEYLSKSKKCVCSGRRILDLTKLGAHGGLGQCFSKRAPWCRVLATTSSRFETFQLRHLLAAPSSIWRSCIYEFAFRHRRASPSSSGIWRSFIYEFAFRHLRATPSSNSI